MVILFVFFLTITQVYASENSVIWKFVKVYKNPFCQKAATDSLAIYMYDVSVEGDKRIFNSGITYTEGKYLLCYFGVKTPEELTGKKFRSDKTDASFAINYLIVQQKHGGNYTPPTYDELYEMTAQAMSEMKCPDFSNEFDKETIYFAFLNALEVPRAKKDWLQKLKNRILVLSNGKVKLVGGPAEYLVLVKNKSKIKVIIGPYSTPVSFYDYD